MSNGETHAMFEVDADGWIAQHSGRPLNELVREVLQNSLDTGADITVKTDTRGKKIEIIDEGPGFDDLSNAWQIFGGDKAADPTMRGRFGRGLKEAAASTQKMVVETVGGRVEFDVENRQRHIYEDQGRESGTRIIMRNPDWKMREVKDVYHYICEFWPPEGQDITVDLKGGKTETLERPEVEMQINARMPTVVINEDQTMTTKKRRANVNITRASGNSGTLYEMGIPILRDTDYPYHVDVQQKVPMAEQRNEPGSEWHNRYLKPALVEAVFDELSKAQLRKDWVTEAVERTWKSDLKEQWVEKVLEDGRKQGIVLSSDMAADDKAENHGYQVFDADRASARVASITESVVEKSSSVAKDLADREKSRVDANKRQQEFMDKMEELAEMCGHGEVTFELWDISNEFQTGTTTATFVEEENVVRLNVAARDWDEFAAENIGTAIHELAHHGTSGHSDQWRKEMQRVAGDIISQMMG